MKTNRFLFRSEYLQEMKQMLYNATEQAPSAELVEPDFLTRYFATFDEQFFHRCDKELAKINTFYSGKQNSNRFYISEMQCAKAFKY